MLLTSSSTPVERRRPASRATSNRFTLADGWATLRSSRPLAHADPLRDLLGRPGLWKLVRSPQGVVRVFELPPLPTDLGEEEDEPLSPDACLAWAQATARGEVPDNWAPPPRSEVDAWLTGGALTVAAGAVVRQGELIHRPDRLALRYPVLLRLPSELSPLRRAWLEELLLDAQDRWRLVRVGLAGDAAWAEVDLTGCPGPLMECLFRAGRDALRWVVGWLAESTAFLADPGATCRAVEVCSPAAFGRGKEE